MDCIRILNLFVLHPDSLGRFLLSPIEVMGWYSCMVAVCNIIGSPALISSESWPGHSGCHALWFLFVWGCSRGRAAVSPRSHFTDLRPGQSRSRYYVDPLWDCSGPSLVNGSVLCHRCWTLNCNFQRSHLPCSTLPYYIVLMAAGISYFPIYWFRCFSMRSSWSWTVRLCHGERTQHILLRFCTHNFPISFLPHPFYLGPNRLRDRNAGPHGVPHQIY